MRFFCEGQLGLGFRVSGSVGFFGGLNACIVTSGVFRFSFFRNLGPWSVGRLHSVWVRFWGFGFIEGVVVSHGLWTMDHSSAFCDAHIGLAFWHQGTLLA